MNMDIRDIKNQMLPMLQQLLEIEVTDESRNDMSDIAEAFEDVMEHFFADVMNASADGVDIDVGETPLIMEEDDDGDDEFSEDGEGEDPDNAEEDIEVTTTQDTEHLTTDQLRKLMMHCVTELAYRAEENDDDESDDDESSDDGECPECGDDTDSCDCETDEDEEN